MKKLIKISLIFGGLLLVLLSFIRIYKISDISMNYMMVDEDMVIVENFSAGVHIPSFFFFLKGHFIDNEKGIERGDIMAFKRHPLDKGLFIKRVVALPGDKVYQENKDFYLQIGSDREKTVSFGQKYGIAIVQIANEIWLKNPYTHFYGVTHSNEIIGPSELITYAPTVIPEHQYFFMGDFRDNSRDSRFFGPVHYNNIYYKVWYVIKKSHTLTELSSIKQF
ncbi:signal peptidase I [Sulfurovum sp. zt1-1]|uniref:Signal peptidase I n=1 Tax=Sulfurovum zhangzhouensis TaxID=3019067 RepID=A0ABT7QV59_9BACT|nr:signal peptidase I [Sulfurovum zhangzhouensis]MDM5270716.1 signal peptidase I [Sulfurovum zhangzhouensis]